MQELDAAQRLILDQLTEEYQQRHGVAVEYVKNAVGEGETYSNAVARVVISKSGAWFECMDQPMEFSGAAGGGTEHHFITDSEALRLLDNLRDLAESAHSTETILCRLLILYDSTGIVDEKGAHLVHTKQNSEPRRVGTFRPGQLPLLFRCRFDTTREIPGVSFKQGVILCMSGLGERNLVVEFVYGGRDLRDLANVPLGKVPQ